MAKYQPIVQRLEKVSTDVADFIGNDAKARSEAGFPEHPFVHAQALLINALELVKMPVEDGIEIGDEAGVKEMLKQADIFKDAMIKVANLASGLRNIPTAAVVIGMLGATSELLDGFFPDLEVIMEDNEEEATPQEAATSVEDILRGIQSHE